MRSSGWAGVPARGFAAMSPILLLSDSRRWPERKLDGDTLAHVQFRRPGAGRGVRRRRARHARARGPVDRRGARARTLVMADLHRQHRRRIPVGLLHDPAARAAARVELPAASARHRGVRGPYHVLDDAGRNRQNARATSLWPRGLLHRGEPRGGAAGPLSRNRAGATRPGPRVTVAVWAGVVLIGGLGAVLR